MRDQVEYHHTNLAMWILSAWSTRPISWQKASLSHSSLATSVIQTPDSAKSQIIPGQEPPAKERDWLL